MEKLLEEFDKTKNEPEGNFERMSTRKRESMALEERENEMT